LTRFAMLQVMGVNDRIGLGTVQFGLNYGISNTTGKVSYDAAREIVQYYCNAVTRAVFDTASAYGESEDVLGKLFTELGIAEQVRVISKFSGDVTTAAALNASFQSTVKRLQLPRLYAFLAHDAEVVRAHPDVYAELTRLKEEGYVQKIGVSAYYPSQVQWLLENGMPPDLIQVPYNVLDRRFEPFFKEYKDAGIEVHTRSAFLQGLFFKPLDSLNEFFYPVKEHIAEIQGLAGESGLTLNKLLLLFCLEQPGIDNVIIGVDSVRNIQDNMITAEDVARYRKVSSQLEQKRSVSEKIILPFNWPKS